MADEEVFQQIENEVRTGSQRLARHTNKHAIIQPSIWPLPKAKVDTPVLSLVSSIDIGKFRTQTDPQISRTRVTTTKRLKL